MHRDSSKKASLVVVGSGIKFISHLSTEAKTYIQNSDLVLYLVNDPAMQEWIQNNSKHSESLDEIYVKYPLRNHCYEAITDYILEKLYSNLHLCVVIYGHPTVLAQPTLEAVKEAQAQGYYAKALPGISSLDCLFADLLIDPGDCGCQFYEASDFLIRRRKFDPSSHLLLFQIGCLGILGHEEPQYNEKNLSLLIDYLTREYPKYHQVLLYEAAQYPSFEPNIDRCPIVELPYIPISSLSTLYIPPACKLDNAKDMLSALSIRLEG